MATPRNAEALDVIEHIGPGFIARHVASAGGTLGLHRRDEALNGRVVPAIVLPPHAAGNA